MLARRERKPQCSDKKKLCHWTWWTSRLIQLFICSIYSQQEHFLLLRKFIRRLILLRNPRENAMNCHGILSIIRFTKKDIFTYIDGFDEAGIMKYFFYFLKIATTLFFWGPIFIYLNNWTNLWAFHYHVFFVTFVHPHRKLLLSNIKTIEDKFSQDKRKSWLQSWI